MQVRTLPLALLTLACSTPMAHQGEACPASGSLFPAPYLQKREGWYGPTWRALNAEPICRLALGELEVFRFVWLPSFDPAVAVTVSLTSTGSTLVAKRLNGAGGYAPGSVAQDISLTLSSAQEKQLQTLVQTARFFTESTEEPSSESIGLDGAQWILEWSARGRYHAVDRWSPQRSGRYSSFRRLGEWFLRTSGLVSDSLVAGY